LTSVDNRKEMSLRACIAHMLDIDLSEVPTRREARTVARQRRCESCSHLERLTQPGVLRGLVHRGGLRADVLSSGRIRIGNRVEALP
jgi:hypothetical protein